MNRVCDYCGFIVRFLGVGYLAVWPLAEPGPLAAAGVCDGAHVLDGLCRLPHLMPLPPGLHAVGLVCALFVALWLLLRPLARWRRRRTQDAVAFAARVPAVTRPAQQKPFFPRATVQPRNEFGLRGRSR